MEATRGLIFDRLPCQETCYGPDRQSLAFGIIVAGAMTPVARSDVSWKKEAERSQVRHGTNRSDGGPELGNEEEGAP
jgi:hypothetical protein